MITTIHQLQNVTTDQLQKKKEYDIQYVALNRTDDIYMFYVMSIIDDTNRIAMLHKTKCITQNIDMAQIIGKSKSISATLPTQTRYIICLLVV